MPIKVGWTVEAGVAVVTIEGPLDIETVPRLAPVLGEAIQESPDVVLDMTRVSFCDSVGLSALLVAVKAARKREGTITLLRPVGQVRRLLELTGLEAIFQIEPAA